MPLYDVTVYTLKDQFGLKTTGPAPNEMSAAAKGYEEFKNLPHNGGLTVQEIHVKERGRGGVQIKAETLLDWMRQHSAPYDTEPYDDGEYEEVFSGPTFTPSENDYVIRHKKSTNIFKVRAKDRFEAASKINVGDWEPDPNNTPDEGFEEEDEE